MKRTLLLLPVIITISICSYAQQGILVQRNYIGSSGVNGFRSVAEENAMIEQMMAERRRKEKEESNTPEENKLTKTQQADGLIVKNTPVRQRTMR
jgi:hypothetical protein